MELLKLNWSWKNDWWIVDCDYYSIIYSIMGIEMDVEELKKRFNVKKSGSGLYYRDGDYEMDNTIRFHFF